MLAAVLPQFTAMKINWSLALFVGLCACSTSNLHIQEAEDENAKSMAFCKDLARRAQDRIILYENLLNSPTDSLLLVEKSLLEKAYREDKWNCQLYQARTDSALAVLEADLLAQDQSLKDLKARDQSIEDRLKALRFKPLDSLRIMK